MKTSNRLSIMGYSWIFAGVLSFQTQAALISNGGFESGFSDWTRLDQAGSEGTFHLQSGTASPVNLEAVPAPPGGSIAAMTDAEGPGAHVLYQTFTVSSLVPSTTLDFDLFIGNRAVDFFAPDTLDFATPSLNQQARIDILKGGSDPFSVDPADVLLNVFHTSPGDTLVSGYTHHSLDITTLLNGNLSQPLMLRFAETDNVFTFQLGVDNVAIEAAAVPESLSLATVYLVLLGLCWAGRRKLLCSRRIT
jgi:hypothetical protein